MNSCFVKAFLLVGDADRSDLDARNPNNGDRISLNHAVCRTAAADVARRATSGRSRTAARASASAPPSSRSTTQTAVETRSPASRSASTASSAAPPEVTTSSTRQTQLARLEGALDPVRRCRSPSPRLRTITNGSPTASEAAAASGTAPSSGAARRTASGLVLADGRRDRLAERRAAGRAAWRSGTCRGSTSCACPSGGRSRPRAAPRRGSPRRARRVHGGAAITGRRSGSRASASSRSRLGRAVGERDHRAVLGVELDALEPARRAAPVEHRAGAREPRRDEQHRRRPTPRHRPSFAVPLARDDRGRPARPRRRRRRRPRPRRRSSMLPRQCLRS